MNKKILKEIKDLPQDVRESLILGKLFEIEKQLHKKIAYLSVEDAIKLFRGYLQTKKKPRGYEFVLDNFEEYFKGKNIAEVTAEDCEEFMTEHWINAKANTIRTRHAQLTGLFNHSIKVLMKKGSPTFHNPMKLITIPQYEINQIEFLPIDKMKEILQSTLIEHYWLSIAIMASSGARTAELLDLEVKDKNGPVLTLHNPKSGNKEEWIVIPETVNIRLDKYIEDNGLQPGDRIIPIAYSTLYKFILRISKKCGNPFTPHYLRKWCSSFWDRQGERKMEETVLRHRTARSGENSSHIQLRRIYIAPLSIEEVIEKQKIIDKNIFYII